MERYLILDLQDNMVASTQKLEFPDINEGWSVACRDIHEAIDEMESTLEDLRKIVAKRERTCSWCGEEFESSELKETAMGKMCDRCVRGVESREGEI